MSEPEDFLARWSRLKRESGTEESGGEKLDAVLGTDMSTAPAFDPASLPPIESIVADSDIRPFLAAGVPAELTRLALRSAWSADPAIRDFIGIAESQWDFNDPGAIPGFGPLAAAEYPPVIETRVLSRLNNTVERIQESPAMADDAVAEETPSPASVDLQYSAPTDEVRQVDSVQACSSRDAGSPASEAGPGSPARHSHGGALPR
jgi:hypothetical protein